MGGEKTKLLGLGFSMPTSDSLLSAGVVYFCVVSRRPLGQCLEGKGLLHPPHTYRYCGLLCIVTWLCNIRWTETSIIFLYHTFAFAGYAFPMSNLGRFKYFKS